MVCCNTGLVRVCNGAGFACRNVALFPVLCVGVMIKRRIIGDYEVSMNGEVGIFPPTCCPGVSGTLLLTGPRGLSITSYTAVAFLVVVVVVFYDCH